MNKIILFSLMLFLSSCGLDESFEDKGKIDRDDTNIINKYGLQSLDKAINLYDTRTNAS